MAPFELSSPAFADGDPIPRRYGYAADNVNPPLEIRGAPDGTGALVLVVDDPDAVEPAGKVWNHWLVWNVDPDTRTIPEDWNATDAVEGTNDFGDRGYGGPDPPDREHTYRFFLSAIDGELDLPPGATREDVDAATEGRMIEETRLKGTYAP